MKGDLSLLRASLRFRAKLTFIWPISYFQQEKTEKLDATAGSNQLLPAAFFPLGGEAGLEMSSYFFCQRKRGERELSGPFLLRHLQSRFCRRAVECEWPGSAFFPSLLCRGRPTRVPTLISPSTTFCLACIQREEEEERAYVRSLMTHSFFPYSTCLRCAVATCIRAVALAPLLPFSSPLHLNPLLGSCCCQRGLLAALRDDTQRKRCRPWLRSLDRGIGG